MSRKVSFYLVTLALLSATSSWAVRCERIVAGMVGGNRDVHTRVISENDQVVKVEQFDFKTGRVYWTKDYRHGKLSAENYVYDDYTITKRFDAVGVAVSNQYFGPNESLKIQLEIQDGRLVRWDQISSIAPGSTQPGEMTHLKVVGIMKKTAQLVGETSGKVYAECPMENGQLHGKFKWVDVDTGSTLSEGEFRHNQRVGRWVDSDVNGFTLTMEYDGYGNMIHALRPSCQYEMFTDFDARGNKIGTRTLSQRDQSTTRVQYDPYSGQTLLIEVTDGGSQLKRRQRFSPDSRMCLRDEQFVDGRLNRLEVFDPKTLLLTKTDANGNVESVLNYDPKKDQFSESK